jgi:hypothetical protein
MKYLPRDAPSEKQAMVAGADIVRREPSDASESRPQCARRPESCFTRRHERLCSGISCRTACTG